MADDTFGTRELRARVLAAWSASPARFREDANAEDDLVRGGYRDRVVVELAQNAADAAARAGVEGRLTLRLRDDLLVAENIGAPLDAAGVESLSTLRASTKRGDGASVGRFGVGFAAVLAVTDEPRIASATGAVRWDAAAARRDASAVASVAEEVARRGGQVPVLRLPYAWDEPPPTTATTVVELPLRDAAARELVTRLLAEVDDALLLALPSLAAIDVEVDGDRRTVTATDRWHVVRRAGRTVPALLADRPVEERERPTWSLTWARPLAGQLVPPCLHAPTPTDEPLDLPVLLVASFPLDTTRRHVASGPLTDALVREAAAAFVALVSEVPDPAQRWALVPGPMPVGRLDGQLRSAVREALAAAPVLRTVDGAPVAPKDAVSIVGASDDLVGELAGVVDGLVADHTALEQLGGRRLRLVDAVDLLAGLERPPDWWRRLYAALSDGPVDSEALGSLPVPLADGRLVRGPRGALLPEGDLPPDLSSLGLRLVHPDAAHPLLLRLGAATAAARTVLDRPEVREAVDASWDHPEPDALASVVLDLVERAGLRRGQLPWLAALRLTDVHGDPAVAEDLVLPGSFLADLAGTSAADQLGEVDPALVARWGRDVLSAAGVLADLTVTEVHDLVLDRDGGDDDAVAGLDGWVDWVLDRIGGRTDTPAGSPPTVRSLRVVPELDVVDDGSWLRVLAHVAGDPELRAALVDPVPVEVGGGAGIRRVTVPSYAAWWLRARGLLEGRRPGEWAAPGASDLEGLWEPLADAGGVPAAVLGAAGVRTSLADVLADVDGAEALLDRLADPALRVSWSTLLPAYAGIAGLDADAVAAPRSVRVDPDTVLPADDVVVVDAAHHLQVGWDTPPLVVPLAWAADLAEVLDVATSSERIGDPAVAGGERRTVPVAVAALLPGAPDEWWEHDELLVAGHPVSWWVAGNGDVHAATLDGLARGLAWAAAAWPARWPVAAVLEDERRAGELADELRLG